MLRNLLLLFSLAGFLVVGFLLATNHPGFAIKITNYLYVLLLVSVLWQVLYDTKV